MNIGLGTKNKPSANSAIDIELIGFEDLASTEKLTNSTQKLFRRSKFFAIPGESCLQDVDGNLTIFVGIGNSIEDSRIGGEALAELLETGDAISLHGGVLDLFLFGLHYQLSRRGVSVELIGEFSPFGQVVGSARSICANWVDTPPNQLTPDLLSNAAEEWSKRVGASFHKFTVGELTEMGAGALLAIGSGSINQPCLLHITSPSTKKRPDLVLVGKGVTFDSGGLSVKNSEDMMSMKNDMAGAAVAISVVCAVAEIAKIYGLDIRVDAVTPLVENMPSHSSVRPSDVVTSMSGKSIEILNTDFEGRVILADALTYAVALQPLRIVDLATLTESIRLALGLEIAGLFTRHQGLADELLAAFTECGEPLWRMPLVNRYDNQIRSQNADIRNFPGSKYGRSITAARFLEEFVPSSLPWAHLDIAGPAWADEGPGKKGGTGFAVTALCHWIYRYLAPVSIPKKEG